MRWVFVDTHYFVARINPKDQWYKKASVVASELKDSQLVTTEAVLIELMNYLAGYTPAVRKAVANFTRKILDEPEVEVIPHTREALLSGIELYESRLDKGYSLTNCISMSLMRERHITDVLTHDNHFTQEGFNVLI